MHPLMFEWPCLFQEGVVEETGMGAVKARADVHNVVNLQRVRGIALMGEYLNVDFRPL